MSEMARLIRIEHLVNKYKDYSSLIMFADIPLVSQKSLEEISGFNENCVLGICHKKDPTGCGRIILDNGNIINSVEEKDCTDDQRKIKLVNTGIYLIKNSLIIKYIYQIDNKNKQNEYYLPDLLLILIKNKYKVKSYLLENEKESLNVNTKEDLESAIYLYNSN